MPWNKPLYSVSYMLFTGGAAGLVFAGYYFLVDVHGWRSSTILLEWLGQHAMVIYVLVAEGVFIAALQGLYVGSPENNLVRPCVLTTVSIIILGCVTQLFRVGKYRAPQNLSEDLIDFVLYS